MIRCKTVHVRAPRAQAQLNRLLASALHAEPSVSLHEVATQLGYSSAQSLRRRNPDICDQISNNYRKSRVRTPAKPPLAAVPSNGTIQRALRKALAQCPRVPVKTVARNLGFRNEVSLYKRFPDLCRAFAVANKREGSSDSMDCETQSQLHWLRVYHRPFANWRPGSAALRQR